MSFKILYFLRHAKAVPSAVGQDDHERPLAERGVNDALRLGDYMAHQGIFPQLVLCSSSLRTRQTLQLLERGMDRPFSSRMESKLYLAAPREVLDLLAGLPENLKSVMVIGHNPTLHQLSVDLAESGDEPLMNEINSHFPTTALAEIHYPAREWAEIGPRSGNLKRFVTPAMMALEGAR